MPINLFLPLTLNLRVFCSNIAEAKRRPRTLAFPNGFHKTAPRKLRRRRSGRGELARGWVARYPPWIRARPRHLGLINRTRCWWPTPSVSVAVYWKSELRSLHFHSIQAFPLRVWAKVSWVFQSYHPITYTSYYVPSVSLVRNCD